MILKRLSAYRPGPVLAVAWLALFQVCHGAEIDQQRDLFLGVYEAVERGDWSPVDALSDQDRKLLGEYVLWPDLNATWLRTNLKTVDNAIVEQFLDQYGTLKPARELRYRYATQRVNSGDLPGFLSIYQQYYQGLEIAKLDCLALQAELDAGHAQRVVNRALELWTVGRSQTDECDPVFTYLQSNDLIKTTDYANRYALAIDAREFSLARRLAKSIDADHVAQATQWQKAQANPETFVRSHAQRPNNSVSREQLAYAIERITYADPVLALSLWKDLMARYRFAAEVRYETSRHIALWTARDNLPDAHKLLTRLPKPAQDDEVMRWRARSSIRAQRWSELLNDIDAMSDTERETGEWTYWQAVALQHDGQTDLATAIFEQLATERSYYGFLAADELNLGYQFASIASAADENAIAELAGRPDLIRARELFLVGLEGRGRSEWDAVIAYFLPDEKRQAAILADRWGWHSQAISTVASSGQYDDLSMRYPLPYQALFQQFSAAASIPPTWAYGIARSESLFMRDVRSSAGAIGLMQLMPATGKDVARDIKLPYKGLDTLTNPSSNIQLGTTYLAQMANRFGGNRILATAAYNAGPHRVDQWLPADGSVDARIWIENIPFNETRKYVRRVLEAETIFHWRLTGETRRLTDELMLVEASATAQQLASR